MPPPDAGFAAWGTKPVSSKHFCWKYGLIGVDQLHIAIAEDNPLDLSVLKEVLDQFRTDYKLTAVVDGQEARDFILKLGYYRNFPPADVIFLDMNMPKLTGLGVLRQIPDSA